MKIHQLLFATVACTLCLSLKAQVTPNSRRFEVRDFIALNGQNNYAPYHAHGFAERTGNGSTSRLFLMPILTVDLDHIKYINSNGLETGHFDDDIQSISIPILADKSLPNESQKSGIGAALESGTNIHGFYRPIALNNGGQPLIQPGLHPGIHMNVMALCNQYNQQLIQQQKHIESYNSYSAELINLTEYEVIVRVGNTVVCEQRFPGSLISIGGALDDVSIDFPTVFIKNRIAQGNFSVIVKYKFLDSKGSFINAQLNAGLIVDQFLSDTQTSTVSQKSSGWSFLGIGKRRKTMKSSFDQQIDQSYDESRFTSTNIEMFDADDDMIKMFENSFFPEISKDRTIESHIAAAAAADDPQIKQLHLDYVNALRDNDPNLEANIGEAVAALSRKDYASFLAHGVRWGDYRVNGNAKFRKVIKSNERVTEEEEWNMTKRISVQHAVTQRVNVDQEEVEYRPYLGLLDGMPHQVHLNMSNGGMFWRTELVQGIVLGPIAAGSPLHQNNFMGGNFLISVGGRSVYDVESFKDALKIYNPGDRINLTVVEQVNQNVYGRKNVTITLGAFPVFE